MFQCCEICTMDVPKEEMVKMEVCTHSICKVCFVNHFSCAIIEKYPAHWNCPACPEQKEHLQDNRDTFYILLEGVMKKEVKLYKAGQSNIKPPVDFDNMLKILEDKLLNEALRHNKNFHWCPRDKCKFGCEVIELKQVQCPNCFEYFCGKCGRKWHNEHVDLTCDEFAMWLISIPPDVSNLLNNYGIQCPECKMRYFVAAGGCLHFECRSCDNKFCGGCSSKFVQGNCPFKNCTLDNSFHAHHPRNCLYYLRDYAVKDLEDMLINETEFTHLRNTSKERNCSHTITEKTMEDRPCGIGVVFESGLCEIHYKEYLVLFINRLEVDPIYFIKELDKLNLILLQSGVPLLEQRHGEADKQFQVRLWEEIRSHCSLYTPNSIVCNTDE